MERPMPAEAGQAQAVPEPDYRKAFWILVAAFAVLRLLFSAAVGLGADETNYWLYAAHPALGYFDHPPLVGWLIWLTTLGGTLPSAFLVRLSGAAFHVGTAWVVFRFCSETLGDRAGWCAAVLYHLAFSFFFSTVFMLPDTPMLFFWMTSVYLLWKGLGPLDPGPRERRLVLAAGLSLGFALLSKFHGLLLPPSLLAFLLLDPKRRRWLARPEPYGALVLALIVYLPALLWNHQHDWVSFRFQGGRGLVSAVTGPLFGSEARVKVNPGWSVGYLAAQAAWINPFVFAFLAVGLVRFCRRRLDASRDAGRFLLWCGAPMIAFFTLNAMGNPKSLPHWTSAGWLTLLWFAAAHLAERRAPEKEGPVRLLPGPWTAAAGGLVLLVFLLAGIQYTTHAVDVDGLAARFDPKARKERKDPSSPVQSLGSRDPSLEAVGGGELAEGLARMHADRVARGLVGPDPFLLTRHWFIAGKVHFHAARKLGMEVRCWGPLRNVRATVFMQDWDVAPGRDAYFILSSARYKDRYRPERAYEGYFASFEEPEVIDVRRAGRVVMRWFVFPCRGVVKPYPNPLLED